MNINQMSTEEKIKILKDTQKKYDEATAALKSIVDSLGYNCTDYKINTSNILLDLFQKYGQEQFAKGETHE